MFEHALFDFKEMTSQQGTIQLVGQSGLSFWKLLGIGLSTLMGIVSGQGQNFGLNPSIS